MNDSTCKAYYQSQFSRYASTQDDVAAVDECLHDFLDGKPAGKYTQRERAVGLLGATFWWVPQLLDQSSLASVAMSRVLWVHDEVDTDLLDHWAKHHPEQLKWALRYSRLFMRADSSTIVHLRQFATNPAWQDFFTVCDQLLAELDLLDELIDEAEQRLKSLSLVELLSYLSVMAYSGLETDASSAQRNWTIYERIIQRKLKRCTVRDFHLTEKILGKSLKKHLSPLLFPGSGSREKCIDYLTYLAALIAALEQRLEREADIEQFCFNSAIDYQWRAEQLILFEPSDEHSQRWRSTERKAYLLWQYWLNRALVDFVASGLADKVIGSADNAESNQNAMLKTFRDQLVMREIFGFDDKLLIGNGQPVDLFRVMLAAELSSAFFDKEFVQPYRKYAKESASVMALGRLAFEGLLSGENRFPMTWSELPAKIKRIRSWTVSDEHPQGDAAAAKSILDFWTVDLRQLADQIREKPRAPVPRLSEQPFYRIGKYSFQFPWIAGQQNNLVAAVNALRRIDSRRPELRNETMRVESRLADSMRRTGFNVVTGYQPPVGEEGDAGEVDLICHLDGIVLLLEVKSGFIRSSLSEVWQHRTNTLRKAARQLKRKQAVLEHLLLTDTKLRDVLGLNDMSQSLTLHAWIVDTSIDCDGELIDGYRVVSREVMEVALMDQKHFLSSSEQELNPEHQTLYPNSFSAQAFVDVINGEQIWQDLLS